MTEVTSGVIVRVKHVRMAGVCARGMLTWFRNNDLDFKKFTTEGLPVEVIEATGDKVALDVARVAREDHGRR